MTATEELKKAIELAERAADILQKSQMAFDFNVGTPHHVAYTRTNASGTVSNVQAKGAPSVYDRAKDKAATATAKAVDSQSHTAAASAHLEASMTAGEGTPEQNFHQKAYAHHMNMAIALPHKTDSKPAKPTAMSSKESATHLQKLARHPSTDMARKIDKWNEAHSGKDIPADKIAGTEARHYTPEQVYGKKNAQPGFDDFSPEFKKVQEQHGHDAFVLNHHNGHQYLIDTQGYDYARYVGHIKKG